MSSGQVPLDAIQGELEEIGLSSEIVGKLTAVLTNKSIDAIASVLGPESKAVKELEKLFILAEGYGISDWLVFDASVVRGLAYYTGLVFEAFDRKGALRAIAGGGRYDKLLETFGGEPTPAAGFGFGDAVIVELLKDRDLLPKFDACGFDTVVFSLDKELQGNAASVASTLRKAGQSVDLILEQKKIKWVFKYADRIGVKNVVIVAPDEWERGEVSVKDMAEGSQKNVKVEDISAWATKMSDQ